MTAAGGGVPSPRAVTGAAPIFEVEESVVEVTITSSDESDDTSKGGNDRGEERSVAMLDGDRGDRGVSYVVELSQQ